MKQQISISGDTIKENQLFIGIAELIELARKKVLSVVNLTMVHTYFEIGRMIVEDEQEGKERAEYGKKVLKDLSIHLTERFGKGFSEQNLRNMRQFYQVYSAKVICQKPSGKLKSIDTNTNDIQQKPSAKTRDFTLSWSHYLVLMRIENLSERSFYEIEAYNQNWSEPQLKRQYHSSLYERLALSRNKDEVMKLATEGQIIVKPEDILKNPLTLEFLGLEGKDAYSESDMEHSIISKLQQFILELGKGFLFEARQKRFTFDEKYYFVDLVFYNRLLQCFVIIDLKTDEIEHKDLGQMQMYVNYYDRYVKLDYEKPTIGILLCKKSNNALVELTLPKDVNIYASEYSLYLPDKQLLQQKLNEWLLEFENPG
jgi:predicted nuclease of restriction endonuclease-like (RecB) superfamily